MTTPDSEQFLFNTEIVDNIKRFEELIGILYENNLPAPIYRRSVFIEVLIIMKDLLMKAHNSGKRISFTDDVIPSDNPRGKIDDVTSLINNFRDAACHIDSPRREMQDSYLSYNETRGKNPNALIINGVRLGCDYDDDIAFVMGGNKMYLKRHLERAFQELKTLFAPILNTP